MYRRTGARVTLLCMIVSGSLVCPLATAADGAAESDTLLLETLLKQQAAAFEAIKSVEMEYTYRIERVAEPKYAPDGAVAVLGGREIQSGTIKSWMQGEYRREHHQYQREYPDRDAIMRDTKANVSTPKLYINYTESVNQIYLHHLDDQLPVAPAIARATVSIPWWNLLDEVTPIFWTAVK